MTRTSPTLLLFGGTRGTGLELARLARARGMAICAMARAAADAAALEETGATVRRGDAREAADVAAIVSDARVRGGDIVCVSTLGGGPIGRSADFLGNARVTDALEAAGLARFVLVTSLGCGDSRAFASERLIAAIGPTLEEKTRAERHAAASGLALTIVRPAGLLSGGPTGCARLTGDPSVHGRINRADLAALLLACFGDQATVGRTFSAVDPTLVAAPR